MKMIMIAFVATSLLATTAASSYADTRKGNGKITEKGAVVGGKSFDGRSSLGGPNSFGSRKSHSAPRSSTDDETFDGRKFFDDSMINGG